MKVITAPEDIYQYSDVSCFLAGGITNCPEWQDEIIEKLKDTEEGVLYNPRRKNFPMEDPNAASEQIKWEFEALAKADVFSMWYSNADSDQPICMYELGRNLAIRSAENQLNRVCIGVEPGYRRAQDVEIQTALVSPSIQIVSTIEEHTKNLVKVMNDIANEKLNSVWR
jgi:hypothetical protein